MIGKPARQWLMAMMAATLAGCATTPAKVRQIAVQGGAGSVERVAAALHASDQPVRQAAAESLMTMGSNHGAREMLVEALHSNDAGARSEAAAVLVLASDPDLQNDALALLQDPDVSVRGRLTEALIASATGSDVFNARAAIYLWGMSQDSDSKIRAEAVYGLGTLGLDDPVQTALSALQKDPEARVRGAAARGLGIPARAYLTAKSLAPNDDAKVSALLAQQFDATLGQSIHSHGPQIVDALCAAATDDKGGYTVTHFQNTLFGIREITDQHWVALDASTALFLPGVQTPSAVLDARVAALKFVGTQMASPDPITLHRSYGKPHTGI